MQLVSLWVEKYVEQGVSRPAAKAMTYTLFLLVFGSALAATLVGMYLLAGRDESVENVRGYGLASILLGNGVAAGTLLWARIKREPPWLPWAAGAGLTIAVVASVANVVLGLVACVVVVVLLAGVIVRLGRQRGRYSGDATAPADNITTERLTTPKLFLQVVPADRRQSSVGAHTCR